ncbi:unnamed protein product [Paramecium pentaurelia]|uniref:WD40-repeat-containing domain n=1 Tax=Paramecium pentaurelia TaxID=43138 RepID=A0A8S1V867_9CILI|nr:unnamed protein product [Paramecium pentaurelia]
MENQNEPQFRCPLKNHSKNIDMFCFDENCKQFRLSCQDCYKAGFHIDHQNYVLWISELNKVVQEQKRDFSSFIQQIEQHINQLNFQFCQFKEVLYFKSDEINSFKLESPQLINQFLSFSLQFQKEKQLILNYVKKINENLKNIIQQFKNNLQLKTINQELKSNKINYQLMEGNQLYENHIAVIALNLDNSIMLAGYQFSQIKVFSFKNGILSLIQTLNDHKFNVQSLYFMKRQNSFISGSNDKTIIVWNNQNSQQFQIQQILEGHNSGISQLIMNKQEDLIISGSHDGTIKFWKQQKRWNCYQTFSQHQSSIFFISLNESENLLISGSGQDNHISIIQYQAEEQKWILMQTISLEMKGARVQFIGENQFTFQPYKLDKIHLYTKHSLNQYFFKTQEFNVKSSPGFEYPFTEKWIKSKSLLVSKNGSVINLIKVTLNGELITEQSIEFKTCSISGTLSDDGMYLFIWDMDSKKIQIRKLQQNKF